MDHHRVLAWAETHVRHFDESARAFASKHPNVLVTKLDSHSGEQVVVLRPRRLPMMDDWPLIIGDALHNMRVALDYLTFSIVKPAVANWELTRKTQFPICKRREDWAGAAAHRLSTLDKAVRDAFEELQPYHV